MSQETVLVVDDNQVTRRLTEVLLNKAGYDVRSASDAAQAERVAKEFGPALILMDVQLPDVDGLELTRRFRADPAMKGVVILAYTANNGPDDEEKAKEAGCDGYIVKPIDARTFADQVRKYLPEAIDASAIPADLRREFITEGHKTAETWAATKPAELNRDAARGVLHHWTGIGGTLGYPEITARARELHSLLDTSPETVSFTAIRDLFAAALAAGFEPAKATAKAGVFGFEPAEVERIAGAFKGTNIAAVDLGLSSEGLSNEFLSGHDLVVLNTAIESGADAWKSVFSKANFEKPVLMIAALKELPQMEAISVERPADIVFPPWEPEEIAFRARRILDRRGPAKKRRTVILADDDPMVYSLLAPLLEKAGIECRNVGDGRQALDAIRSSPPDAAILDIGIPRISGLTVLTEVRKSPETRALPIMMLTARQQQSEVNKALSFGANDYMVKPFRPADVVARLLRLMPR